MKKIQTIVLGFCVIGIIVLAFVELGAPKIITNNFGSLSSPDINSPYLGVNRLRIWSIGNDFIASTTPCAFKNPTGSTSTALWIGLNTRHSTGSPITYNIATSTTAYATTSSLGTYRVPAGETKSISVVATSSVAQNGFLLGPSDWVVIGAQTFNGGGHNPIDIGGTCGINIIEN